jgi:hypothetical protein
MRAGICITPGSLHALFRGNEGRTRSDGIRTEKDLYEGRNGMARTRRVTATVKMHIEEDSDLVTWWHSLPLGSRNAIMKDLMRDYIERYRGSYSPIYPRSQPQPFDPRHFVQLVEDAAWIRSALMDLPGYVEQVIQQVAGMGLVAASGSYTGASTHSDIPDDAAQRREQRLKQAQW